MKPVQYKLTHAESNAFNAFAEERVMAAKAIKPTIRMTRDQEDHLRACFFNCISDAYSSGMASENRKKKPDAIGTRQILQEIDWILDQKNVPGKKYLRTLGDRVRTLSKQYLKSKKGAKSNGTHK